MKKLPSWTWQTLKEILIKLCTYLQQDHIVSVKMWLRIGVKCLKNQSCEKFAKEPCQTVLNDKNDNIEHN